MTTSKPIQYLILIALIFTIPIHPKSMLGYCTDVFHLTKKSVTDLVKGQTSTKTKIGVGLAALVIAFLWTYVLLKRAMHAPKTRSKPRPVITPEYISDAAFFHERGIDIEDIDDETLLKAIKEHDKQLILMLLKYNIPIGCKCSWYNFRRAPLAAAIMNDASLVDLLLRNTQNVNQGTINDAIVFAIENGRLHDNATKSLQFLLKYKKNISLFLRWAALKNPKALEILIQHGKVEETLTENYLSSALISIAKEDTSKEQRKGIKILLKHGANINEKQLVNVDNPYLTPLYKQVKTPLSEAALYGNPRTVRFLLKQGAEIVTPGTNVSAYDYIKDIKEDFDGARARKEQMVKVLDNHRLDLAGEHFYGVRKELASHLNADTFGIVIGYTGFHYPLKKERPIRSYKYVDDGCGSDSEED